ncbi:MAG: tetratricopeptide repeat protein [Spirochaetia bacterium]
MIKISFLAAVFAVALVVSASAQAFTVSYLDGTVELRSAKGWTSISIGDKVPANSTIRISESGSVELLRAGAKITLLKDGTYSVASLSAAAGNGASSGVGSTVARKLQTLVTEKPQASTAGGVRGAEQGTNSVTWVDENDETRTKVQDLLDKSRYAEAVTLLNDSLKDSSSDADTAEFTYLLGVAYYGAGQTAKAFRALARVTPQPETAWYARYVILKAQVLVDTQNYSDALDVLTPFISAYPTGEATQVAYLLEGISDKGLGDKAAAKAALDAGFQLDPKSDTARLIDQQRTSL